MDILRDDQTVTPIFFELFFQKRGICGFVYNIINRGYFVAAVCQTVEEMLMNIRESMEQRERELLSPYASHSADTRGREHPEEECDVRTTYQRDRDRILHCKAFRRMKDKTQVFLAPQGDHYRTRLTHTLEVSQIARTIAKALR